MHIDFRSRGIVIALAVIAAIATLTLRGIPPQGIDLKGGGELRYKADTEDIDTHIANLEAKKIATDIELAAAWRVEELKDMEENYSYYMGKKQVQTAAKVKEEIDELKALKGLNLLKPYREFLGEEIATEKERRRRYTSRAADVVRKRLNSAGVSGNLVQAARGRSDSVIIQIPREKIDKDNELERIKSVMERQGVLAFRMCCTDKSDIERFKAFRNANPKMFVPENGVAVEVYAWSPVAAPNVGGIVELNHEIKTTGVYKDRPIYDYLQLPSRKKGEVGSFRLVNRKIELTGDIVVRANPTRTKVNVSFSNRGAADFDALATRNYEKDLAIVLDGALMSAPTIRTKRFNGSCEISGMAGPRESRELATVLNTGSMPVKLRLEHENNVGPSLGEAQIESGKYACLLGAGLVFLFMLLYYRTAGIIADIALALNLAFLLATMSFMSATLTLPGVAGIILILGMAVDANVLVFERIREELGKGRTLKNAVSGGYDRAFLTIVDANVTTLLTAGVLYKYGTGPIKGFATTLSIGILCSMFTQLFVTRTAFAWLLEKGIVKNLPSLAAKEKMHSFNFMGKRKLAIALSIILILFGMSTFVSKYINTPEELLGVDFSGGTELLVKLDTPASQQDVNKLLQAGGVKNVQVQTFVSDADTARTGQGDQFKFTSQAADGKEQAKFKADVARAMATRMVFEKATITSTGAPLSVDSISEKLKAASINATVTRSVSEATADAAMVERFAIAFDGKVTLAKLQEAIPASVASVEVEFLGVSTIGATVASELQGIALLSMFFSLILIFCYIVLRFEFSGAFGAGAVAALAHDTLFTLGAMALCGFKFDLTSLAAILTIIGYSLNDTIVVYDRIRENNLGQTASKFVDVINKSVNQTLGRTILTSATTLVVVLVLFFFGGGALHGFAFALLVGVLVGTYSSIFIASPVTMAVRQHGIDKEAARASSAASSKS